MNQELNMEVVKDEYLKLVKLFSQIEDINSDIKLIKDSLKNEGANPSLVAKIAKAAVRDAKEKLENESQEVIDLVEALS